MCLLSKGEGVEQFNQYLRTPVKANHGRLSRSEGAGGNKRPK